jgi:hypothetical protein
MMTRKQQAVAIGMVAGTVCTALILAYPIRRFGASVPTDATARIAFALRAGAIAMMWLLIAIANVARKRFFSPADIDGSGIASPSADLRIDAAVVQNTLEQAVLASVLYLSLASLPQQDGVAIIPPLLTLFCLGRLTFWIGYHVGGPWRAFGFAVTFYPTVFGYAFIALRLFS